MLQLRMKAPIRIRRQDLSVLMLYYLGYARLRCCWFHSKGKPVARFVTFHDVPDEAAKNFRNLLRFLKRHTNVVTLDDYFAGALSSNRMNVVITFDDGYKGWIRNAVPALKQLAMPATFFVSSGFLGLSKDQEADFILSKLKICRTTTGSLSEEDARTIAQEGFTVGGHTRNHCNLAEIRDRGKLMGELVADKQKLQEITGKEVRYFAYPFGAYRNPYLNLAEIVKEAGYRAAVTTVPGFNRVGSNPHLLCRELTGIPMPVCVFKARVWGAYDGVAFLKKHAARLTGLKVKGA